MISRLAAFKIERRRVSVAVLENDKLDYSGSRDLPSVHSKAVESAIAYVDWIRRDFSLHGVALEKVRADPATWKSKITTEIIKQLRFSGVPIFEIDKSILLSSFAHPPLRYRTQLRKVISSIWPILSTKEKDTGCLDAAALGLYLQVERFFLPA
jgi:hypothetical protein